MSRKKTWEVSDAFWELVQPLIPTNPRVAHKTYQRQQGGGRKTKYSNRLYFSAMVYVLRNGIIEMASSGMPCPVKNLAG